MPIIEALLGLAMIKLERLLTIETKPKFRLKRLNPAVLLESLLSIFGGLVEGGWVPNDPRILIEPIEYSRSPSSEGIAGMKYKVRLASVCTSTSTCQRTVLRNVVAEYRYIQYNSNVLLCRRTLQRVSTHVRPNRFCKNL